MSRPRSAHGSNRRFHPRESSGDYPPLPAPRLPSLRTLNSPPDSDGTSSNTNRPAARIWAARRPDRSRTSEDWPSNLDDLATTMDQPWSMTSRRRLQQLRHTPIRPANLDDLDRSLDEANSHLRALLDMTSQSSLSPSLLPPTYSPQQRTHDFPIEDTRRGKRRKLDAERRASSFRGFRYGQYGQVEPGQLQMEMVSCDGGMFSNETSYAAENILKDDGSVYCTKGNRCNIILRHQGGTNFAIRELIIKAPGSMNYSHPIREGMVFIAMEQNDLLSRTAQYQIQYASHTRERFSFEQHDNTPYFTYQPRPIISVRHNDDGTTSSRARSSLVYHIPEDDGDFRTPQMPSEFTSSQPGLHVTTECSGGDEEASSGTNYLLRLYPAPPHHLTATDLLGDRESESDGLDDPSGLASEDDGHRLTRVRAHEGTTPLAGDAAVSSENSISLTEAWDAHAQATQEAVRAVGGELLTPHARFHIQKKKSRCTIRFDPPVSGRYILLKIWSSHLNPGSNIDIESVMARGYAGPRYFPSVQMR